MPLGRKIQMRIPVASGLMKLVNDVGRAKPVCFLERADRCSFRREIDTGEILGTVVPVEPERFKCRDCAFRSDWRFPSKPQNVSAPSVIKPASMLTSWFLRRSRKIVRSWKQMRRRNEFVASNKGWQMPFAQRNKRRLTVSSMFKKRWLGE